MRFVFVRSIADEALDAVPRSGREPVPGLLLPGQALAWNEQPPRSCFVIPLLKTPEIATPWAQRADALDV